MEQEELVKLRAAEEASVGSAEEGKPIKKRVIFADEEGLELCEIRIMTEPSDVPPKINSSILRALLGFLHSSVPPEVG